MQLSIAVSLKVIATRGFPGRVIVSGDIIHGTWGRTDSGFLACGRLLLFKSNESENILSKRVSYKPKEELFIKLETHLTCNISQSVYTILLYKTQSVSRI